MLIKTAFCAAIAAMMLTSASLANDGQARNGDAALFHLAASKTKQTGQASQALMTKKKRGGGGMAKDEVKNCVYGNNHITVCDLCSKDSDGDEVCIVDAVCYKGAKRTPC